MSTQPTKDQRRKARKIYAEMRRWDILSMARKALAKELSKADDPAVLEAVLRIVRRRRKWRNAWTWVFHLLVIYVSFRLWYVDRQNEALRSQRDMLWEALKESEEVTTEQLQKLREIHRNMEMWQIANASADADSIKRNHALRDSLFQRATGTEFAPLVRAMEYTDRQAGN